MAAVIKTWMLILRCFRCRGKFTFRHLEVERILILSEVFPCPHCAARPYVPPGDRHAKSLTHDVYNLEEETESVFRKSPADDTWHFSQHCSQWPNGDYLVLEAPPSVGRFCNECAGKQPSADN
jgi:hypothetical protein